MRAKVLNIYLYINFKLKLNYVSVFLEYISKHYSDFDDKEARRTLRELHHELNRKT